MNAVVAPVRSARERIVQTLWFEGVGLALIAPLYSAVAGADAAHSLALLALLSLLVMFWAAIYNTLFDKLEARLTGRVASDRTTGMRVWHALGLEATAIAVSWPLIYAMTDLDWLQALGADVALTLTYAVYGYLFHCIFDRLRPVAAAREPRCAALAPAGEHGQARRICARTASFRHDPAHPHRRPDLRRAAR